MKSIGPTVFFTCLCLGPGVWLAGALVAAATAAFFLGWTAFAPFRLTLGVKSSSGSGADMPACLAFSRCLQSMLSSASVFLFLNDYMLHITLA